MRKVLVASRTFGHGAKSEEILSLFARYSMTPQFLTLKKATQRLNEFEAIILGTEKFKRTHFEKGEKLRVICKYGVGTDNIDQKAAQESGVEILNLPGINCDAVAEMALGLMFSVARRIAEGDRLMRRGRWEQLMGLPVKGKTLGLIGTGAIGMTLARMVGGLGMKILAYDLRPNEALATFGGEYVSLDELLKKSDFISLHVPLNEKTFHFLSDRQFRQMKKEAIIVNTSRGPIIDERALYDALNEGRIGGAGLDVFETEPPIGHKILELDNVVCTPHISAYTYDTLRRMDTEAVKALNRVLSAG